MERLAEDRKGPSSAEHKKRQMLGALATSLQVPPTGRHLSVACSAFGNSRY